MPRGSAPGERRGGRKPGTPNKHTAEIRAVAQQYGPAAIAALAELSGLAPGTRAESETARIAAIKELLDRGYGKSAQPLSGDADAPPMLIDFRWADADEAPASTNMSPLIEAQAADAEVDADPVATWGSSC
jgi:hypothetical protein